jgi:hypothetical protein
MVRFERIDRLEQIPPPGRATPAGTVRTSALAVATGRPSLTGQGQIRYALKAAYRDGTTQVVFEPLEFLSRLAALMPAARVNLTRFEGVFAPHHRLRAQIAPARSSLERAAGQAGGQGGRQGAELGAAPQAGLWHRDRTLRAVRGRSQDHSIGDAPIIEKILQHVGLGGAPPGQLLARTPPAWARLCSARLASSEARSD